MDINDILNKNILNEIRKKRKIIGTDRLDKKTISTFFIKIF